MIVSFITVKPLTIRILKTQTPLVADRRYEVSCESAGSRPSAIITWYKGKRHLKRTRVSNLTPHIFLNTLIFQIVFLKSTFNLSKCLS